MADTGTLEPEGRERLLSKTEKIMARHMGTAWSAPMFGVTVEVAMENVLARRADGVTVTDILLADCAATLVEHPSINAHFREDRVIEYDTVNIGLAVASDRGLAVPVIHGAEALSLTEIAERRKTLVGKVRDGKIGIREVSGGTFTVSNLGMFGVTRFTAIINPPQVAILAIGATTRRQVWNGGAPEWRDIAELSLTSDHRAVDGAASARFLASLKARLEGREAAK
ncbi:pyruvate dehydrogenase E2 component (dihydrolipoamide acetyltransferase) [Paracoccus isoporae]|uniref:Pyruvate dehydrogenase E2 component (Dihydrolipoamide acetyltransferase) n=1 Tax=Paracoccus isoporae TaxID=591205 RepID=A0A1G7H4G0_9RHOB|nr:2-oxo acid dehydrogenase subunit E2 [Paracoccus isoporae]SDE95245.1 pyruvate dehydrogenase E2 component (dihydrolipoamide acetyltransferase) [Paracoccus isoporae]